MRKLLLTCSCIFLLPLLLLPPGAYSQAVVRNRLGLPVPSITVSSPVFGTALVYDPLNGLVSPFYDNATESITITGVFANVDDRLLKRNSVAVVINGDQLNPATLTLTGGRRAVLGRSYRNGIYQKTVPLPMDLRWPVRTIHAELVDLKTGKALARDVSNFWDLRAERDVNPYTPAGLNFVGMRAQITDQGLGFLQPNDAVERLESLVKPLLPYPDLASFNSELSQAARSIPRYDDNSNILDACIAYEDLSEPKLSNVLEFAPYATALAEATALYIEYNIAREACNLIIDPVLWIACVAQVELSHCVKSEPQASDFELCIDQIEAEAQSLTIDGVDDIRHQFLNAAREDRGRIQAHASVAALRGSIDAYLRSLKVRWKDRLCLAGPKVEVPDEMISENGKEWLDDWATCRDIRVNNQQGNTIANDNPAVYLVKQDPEQIERLKVELGSAGTFSFFGPSLHAQKGNCAEPVLLPHAEDAARTFRSSFQAVLQNNWYADQPDTMEARVLTKALLPYKLGETVLTEHDIFGPWAVISSKTVGGLQLNWANDVNTYEPDIVPNLKPTWFLRLPAINPYSENGENHRGNLFDISYTVTTGLLNKILYNRSASPDTITFTYKPSWQELAPFGVTRPRGTSPSDEALLNRRTMRQFNRAFRGMPLRKRLEIRIKPVWNPIVYMAPDLDPNEALAEGRTEYEMPLNYGIPILEITFKEPDRMLNGRLLKTGKTWLRLTGGFTDRYFELYHNGPFLTPRMNRDNWGFVVRNNNMLGCSMSVRSSSHSATCEALLELDVKNLIKNRLRETFIDMLREIPAPFIFDMDEEAEFPRFFDVQSKAQTGQNITFYGKFSYLQ